MAEGTSGMMWLLGDIQVGDTRVETGSPKGGSSVTLAEGALLAKK